MLVAGSGHRAVFGQRAQDDKKVECIGLVLLHRLAEPGSGCGFPGQPAPDACLGAGIARAGLFLGPADCGSRDSLQGGYLVCVAVGEQEGPHGSGIWLAYRERPLLIADSADVKTVQARLRHASAKTTLDTYGHLWPDRDESTRATIEAVFVTRETVQSLNQQGSR